MIGEVIGDQVVL